jgi:hypothetical protein
MSQRPVAAGGSQPEPDRNTQPDSNPGPDPIEATENLDATEDVDSVAADLSAFLHPPGERVVDLEARPDPDEDERALAEGRVPVPVLRRWSDALAAAGLYREALQVHPAVERSDRVRRAELAVLAEDPHVALELLAEMADRPWLDLLTAVARVLAGSGGLADVLECSGRVRPSAAVAWMVALAAISAGDLEEAARAAGQARAGGCRDLRIVAVAAADRAVRGEEWPAIELVRGAQRVALPDEDPAELVVEILDRTGHRAPAQRLAARAASDTSLPAPARAAWKAAARSVGAGRKQLLRRSMAAAGSFGTRHRESADRRAMEQSLAGLVCRCYGSTGWIGPERLPYVSRHLDLVLPAPVAGLDARLLRCRATNLTFLDLGERQLTLPVVTRTSARVLPVDPFADPDADPESRPTTGMGVSLGLALHA